MHVGITVAFSIKKYNKGAIMDIDLSDLLLSSALGALLPIGVAIAVSWIKRVVTH